MFNIAEQSKTLKSFVPNLILLCIINSKCGIMTGLKEVNRSKCFGGWQLEFTHEGEETNCSMKFAVYLPPQAETQKVPVIYCLAGAL